MKKPWTIGEITTNSIDILDADKRTVCTIFADNTTDELSPEDEENAKAIIRCVNAETM
jgi:hypothetical protein